MAQVILSGKVSPETAARFDQIRGDISRNQIIAKLIGLYVANPGVIDTLKQVKPVNQGLPDPSEISVSGWRIQGAEPQETEELESSSTLSDENTCSHPPPLARLATGMYCSLCKTKVSS